MHIITGNKGFVGLNLTRFFKKTNKFFTPEEAKLTDDLNLMYKIIDVVVESGQNVKKSIEDGKAD